MRNPVRALISPPRTGCFRLSVPTQAVLSRHHRGRPGISLSPRKATGSIRRVAAWHRHSRLAEPVRPLYAAVFGARPASDHIGWQRNSEPRKPGPPFSPAMIRRVGQIRAMCGAQRALHETRLGRPVRAMVTVRGLTGRCEMKSPATRMVRRLAAGIGVTLASLAFVTIVNPAVGSADCDAGSWWDPVANVCRPPVVPMLCENGSWWDPVANTCRPPVVPPPPMCDNGWWWDPVGNACRPPVIPPP